MKEFKRQILQELTMKMSSESISELLADYHAAHDIRMIPKLRKYPEETEIKKIFKRIPNVRKFKVKFLADPHPVFQKHGIFKREFEPVMD